MHIYTKSKQIVILNPSGLSLIMAS